MLKKILFNSLLGLILIFIWTRFVNLNEILIMVTTRVTPTIVFLFFLLFFLSGALKALRFKILLSEFKFPFKDLLSLTFLGQFLSFFIPVRAGEISKGVYLSAEYKIPFAKTLVWVFIDRFFDFWVVFIFISALMSITPNNLPPKTEILIFGLLVGISLFFVMSIFFQTLLKKIIRKMSMFVILPSIKRGFVSFTNNIIEGFSVLTITKLIKLLFLSTLAIICDSLIWFFIFRSLGFNINLNQAILGDSLSALTFLIPAAPGYIGSAEAAILGVFTGVLGLESNLVSASTIIFHVLTILAILIFGLASIYFLKFDLSLVWKKVKG